MRYGYAFLFLYFELSVPISFCSAFIWLIANPEEIQKHEYAYYSYLKLLTLILLKIEDDLLISQMIEKVDD
jgi:hypothetical protein